MKTIFTLVLLCSLIRFAGSETGASSPDDMVRGLGKDMKNIEVLEQFVRLINLDLNDSNTEKSDRVLKYKFQDGVVAVEIMINDNLTRGLIEIGWWLDAWKIIQRAFLDYKDVYAVQVSGCFYLTDIYGHKQLSKIAYITMPYLEFKKINRENFAARNLPQIGAGYFKISDE